MNQGGAAIATAIPTEFPDPAMMAALLDGLDRLRVGIALFDTEDRLIYRNSHLNFVYRGLSKLPDLTGMSLAALLINLADAGEFAASENATAPVWLDQQLRALNDLSARPLEQKLADGRTIQLKRRALPQGGFVVQWGDVTDSRQGLIRLQDAIEGTADGFALWDAGGQMISCSRAFADAHALPGLPLSPGLRMADFIGRMIKHQVYKPNGSPAAWISEALSRLKSPRGEIAVPYHDGRWFLLLKRTTPDGAQVLSRVEISALKEKERRLAAHADELEYAINELEMAKDQLELQAAGLAGMAEQIDQARTAAEQANLAKTQFLRSITHELRTPLNAVIGFAEVIQGEMFGPVGVPRYVEYAGAIRDSGRHLMQLIGNILDQARLESGRFTLEQTALALPPLIEFCATLFSNRLEQTGLKLTLNIESDLPKLYADETALRQILVNLVGNAMKFTPSGGTITISAACQDRFIHLVVADTGSGIPAGDLQRVLLPFEQVRQGADSGRGGTGLGLPITKSLVELHGGRFWMESEVGVGTTVHFTMPIADVT